MQLTCNYTLGLYRFVPFVTQRAREKQGLSMEVAPHVVRRHNVEKSTDRQTDREAEALFGEMV